MKKEKVQAIIKMAQKNISRKELSPAIRKMRKEEKDKYNGYKIYRRYNDVTENFPLYIVDAMEIELNSMMATILFRIDKNDMPFFDSITFYNKKEGNFETYRRRNENLAKSARYAEEIVDDNISCSSGGLYVTKAYKRISSVFFDKVPNFAYCHSTGSSKERYWLLLSYTFASRYKTAVNTEKAKKRAAKKKSAIDKIMKEIPKTLPKDFSVYTNRCLPHYFFMENAKEKEGYCTHCLKNIPIGKMKHKSKGRCPSCKHEVTFMHKSRYKKDIEDKGYVCLPQKLNKEKFAFRYFVVTRWIKKGEEDKPNIRFSEMVRTFLYKDGTSVDYGNFYDYSTHSYNWKRGIPRQGCFQNEILFCEKGEIYTKGLKVMLRNSVFRHTAGLTDKTVFSVMQKLSKEQGTFWCEIMLRHALRKEPGVELLARFGFMQLLKEKADYYSRNVLDLKAKKIWEVLRVDKQTYKVRLEGKNISKSFLRVVQKFPKLTDEETRFFERHLDTLAEVENFTTAHKAMRYLNAKAEELVGKSIEINRDYNYYPPVIKNGKIDKTMAVDKVMALYKDYLRYCGKAHYHITTDGENINMEEFYYEMKSSMQLFPKHLEDAHNREVALFKEYDDVKKEIADKKAKEIRIKKMQELNERLATIHDQFDYEIGHMYCIMAPMDAYDIIREGQINNICVGTNGYIEDMAEGKTNILFLRKQKRPNKPFVTIEVKDGEIVQVRGYNNQNPDKDVWNFIKKFANNKKLSTKIVESYINSAA